MAMRIQNLRIQTRPKYHQWKTTIADQDFWSRLDFGYVWTRLDTFGHVWIRLSRFCNVFLDTYGFWIRLDTFGHVPTESCAETKYRTHHFSRMAHAEDLQKTRAKIPHNPPGRYPAQPNRVPNTAIFLFIQAVQISESLNKWHLSPNKRAHNY